MTTTNNDWENKIMSIMETRNDTKESDSETTLTRLSAELLSLILCKLSLRMKFAYQRVCRQWHTVLTELLAKQKQITFQARNSTESRNDAQESADVVKLNSSHFLAQYLQIFGECVNVDKISFMDVCITDILLWNISEVYSDLKHLVFIDSKTSLIVRLNLSLDGQIVRNSSEFQLFSKQVVQRFKSLTHLTLDGYSISSELMQLIVVSLHNLQHLEANYIDDLSQPFTKYLKPSIKSLILIGSREFAKTQSSIRIENMTKDLVNSAPQLQTLELHGFPIYTYLIPTLCRKMVALKQLQLSLSKISAATSLVAISELKNLEYLELEEDDQNYLIDDKMLIAVMKQCHQIKTLKLGFNTKLTASSLNQIHKHWSNIEFLRLGLMHKRDQPSLSTLHGIDSNTWTAFSKLTKLQHFLIITESATDNDIARIVSNCGELAFLFVCLTRTTTITQTGIDALIELCGSKTKCVVSLTVENFSPQKITVRTNQLSGNLAIYVTNH